MDAAYLRERAKHLRHLAAAARNSPSVQYLVQLAEDFEEEARKLDDTIDGE